ncbi:hypothetical protein C8R42DRAFT_731606 [Lentinula raphanica]|nr:hypothetical protein C8R42DRAFT_731606 [Lentinula raphanica]
MNKIESNEHKVAEKWSLKPVLEYYTEDEIRANINNLTRELYQTALGINQNNYEVVGIRNPSDECLQAHSNGDNGAGPMLVNTSLHWKGLSAAQMRKSLWNNALLGKLSREARRIHAGTPDGRFGKKVEWKDLFYDRFSKFYKTIENHRQLPGETPEAREKRLLDSYDKRQMSSKISGLRHGKYQNRLKTAAVMLEVAQQVQDDEMETFWSYVEEAVGILGERGMSDEEDGEEDVIIDGVSTKQDVKLVKILWFRHQSFRSLFEKVDQTPKTEPQIFTQQGRYQLKRVRSNIIDNREPPPGYPKQIFHGEYLQNLLPHQLQDLKFKKMPGFVVQEHED